jgi:hypothetical protein
VKVIAAGKPKCTEWIPGVAKRERRSNRRFARRRGRKAIYLPPHSKTQLQLYPSIIVLYKGETNTAMDVLNGVLFICTIG